MKPSQKPTRPAPKRKTGSGRKPPAREQPLEEQGAPVHFSAGAGAGGDLPCQKFCSRHAVGNFHPKRAAAGQGCGAADATAAADAPADPSLARPGWWPVEGFAGDEPEMPRREPVARGA